MLSNLAAVHVAVHFTDGAMHLDGLLVAINILSLSKVNLLQPYSTNKNGNGIRVLYTWQYAVKSMLRAVVRQAKRTGFVQWCIMSILHRIHEGCYWLGYYRLHCYSIQYHWILRAVTGVTVSHSFLTKQGGCALQNWSMAHLIGLHAFMADTPEWNIAQRASMQLVSY